jgi:Tol biopolymer transport system component
MTPVRSRSAAATCAWSIGAAFLILVALRAIEPGVARWSPSRISSPQFESHPAFDPRNGDLYFVRSSPKFEGWRLLTSRCTTNGWSDPVRPPFAGDGVEADPFFTLDGSHLYFISSRTTDGVTRRDLDLWRIDRDQSGEWTTPERLPAPLNSPGNEWYPRIADGWLYFGSDRQGGRGRTDIWRARDAGGVEWQVENLGSEVNTEKHEYEFLPSPDGRSAILMAEDGLYQLTRRAGRWSSRQKLPASINANGTEVGPLFSPSGRSLLFARDTKGSASGELFVARLRGLEAWPPSCPR